ncbi:TFC3 [Candida jiufengensis]|uniref:TFC3 n=1 Tax=Candida jiufengensis TaxID=497108 RepID=UPI0022259F57|nr:TFC3 [Candida jiufengensis]KAI5949900.1 TFC3 [Candida jiufengensis]
MSQFPCTPSEIVIFVAEKLAFSGFEGLLLSELWEFIKIKFNQETELDSFQKLTIWRWLFFSKRKGKEDEDVKFYVTYDKSPITIESNYENFINKQQQPQKLRVLPTDDTQVAYLTGVSNNKKFIQTLGAFPYQLLQEIARHGSKGTWAADLPAATGQDKRSMTGRLAKLEELGLINKVSKFYEEKRLHSTWCVHYKFSGSTNTNHEEEDNSIKTPSKLKEYIVKDLKSATNNIRIFRDLKVELNMHNNKQTNRLFGAVIDTLAENGFVEKITVPDKDHPERNLYAIKLLKDLPNQKQNDILENLDLMRKTEARNQSLDDDDDDDNNNQEEDEEEDKNLTIAKFTDLFPLPTQIYYAIKASGKNGLTAKQIVSQITGDYRHKSILRILENDTAYILKDDKLEPISDYPEEHSKTAIVKQSETEGRLKYYRYYTRDNQNYTLKKAHKKIRPEYKPLTGSLAQLEKKFRQPLEATPKGPLLQLPEAVLRQMGVLDTSNNNGDSKTKKVSRTSSERSVTDEIIDEDSDVEASATKTKQKRKSKKVNESKGEDHEQPQTNKKKRTKKVIETEEDGQEQQQTNKKQKTQSLARSSRSARRPPISLEVEDQQDNSDMDADFEAAKESTSKLDEEVDGMEVEEEEEDKDNESAPTPIAVKSETPIPLAPTTIESNNDSQASDVQIVKSESEIIDNSNDSFTPILKPPTRTVPKTKKHFRSRFTDADVTGNTRRQKLIEIVKEMGGATFTSAKLGRNLALKLNTSTEPDAKTIIRDILKLQNDGILDVQSIDLIRGGVPITRKLLILNDPRPSDKYIEEVKVKVANSVGFVLGKVPSLRRVEDTYTVRNSREALKRNRPGEEPIRGKSRLGTLNSIEKLPKNDIHSVNEVDESNDNIERTNEINETNKSNEPDQNDEFNAFITGGLYKDIEDFKKGVTSTTTSKNKNTQSQMQFNYPTIFEKDDTTSLFRCICIYKAFDKTSINYDEIAKIFKDSTGVLIKKLWQSIRRQVGGIATVNKGIEDFEKIVNKGIDEKVVRIRHLKKIELPFFLYLWDNSDASRIEIKNHKPLYSTIAENLKYYTRKVHHEFIQPISEQIESESMTQKEEILVSTPFYLNPPTKFDIKPKPFEEIRTVIKTAIKSSQQQNSKQYKQLFESFNPINVSEAYKSLIDDGVIMNISEDNEPEKLKLTEKVFNGLINSHQINFFKQANLFKDTIDDITSQMKGLILSQAMKEGNVAELISLLSLNEISLIHIDKKITFTGYESRSMNKDELDCDLIAYKNNNKNQEEIHEIEVINNIPVPLNKPCFYIWINIDGTIDAELWKSLIAAILYNINFHPGLTKNLIYKKLKNLISTREFDIILHWLVESNVIYIESDGVFVKSNFLNILGSSI